MKLQEATRHKRYEILKAGGTRREQAAKAGIDVNSWRCWISRQKTKVERPHKRRAPTYKPTENERALVLKLVALLGRFDDLRTAAGHPLDRDDIGKLLLYLRCNGCDL